VIPTFLRARWAFLPAVAISAACLMAPPVEAQEAACAPVVTTEVAPPPLPAYDQPPLPAPGYIWTPGYWSWDENEADYYWVPGTWVDPPRPGFLWTPGYWAWIGGQYLFHAGYWGPRVGFYGGIAYGFGYTGEGYEGGRWDHGAFYYNRTVNNLEGAQVRNVYEKTVIANNAAGGASFNGGRNGTIAKPTPDERAYDRESHFAPTSPQQRHAELSAQDPKAFEKSNQGKPPVAATSKPGELKGPGVMPATPIAGPRVQPAGGETKPALANPPASEVSKPVVGAPPAAPRPNPPAAELKKPEIGGPPPAPKPQIEATKPQPPPQLAKPPAPQPPPQLAKPLAPQLQFAKPEKGPPPGGPRGPAKAQGKKPEGKKQDEK
jgi:WXXGXW repeat (2 copies)